MLTCRSLRGAILTSGLMLVAAWVIEAFAAGGLLPLVTASYFAFLLLLVAALVLGGTFLLSLLPSVAQRLAGCEH